MKNTTYNPFIHREDEDTKREYAKQLFKTLNEQPLSRRMAATQLGFPDQTYMVTQFIYDWIKQGKAQVIGDIKCDRSGRIVEAITTNPELLNKSNQLNLFE
ncbi:hypothetical protein N9545_04740 [Salibacteraceae bacterium]|nr:hypothetical protein [Salibacteraceae bacterium]MDB9708863.1 hypothetical protein [Salibacteraceae bacterium]MDC1304659.1 hypothetical protein [Salibacteraceae bacterium]